MIAGCSWPMQAWPFHSLCRKGKNI